MTTLKKLYLLSVTKSRLFWLSAKIHIYIVFVTVKVGRSCLPSITLLLRRNVILDLHMCTCKCMCLHWGVYLPIYINMHTCKFFVYINNYTLMHIFLHV